MKKSEILESVNEQFRMAYDNFQDQLQHQKDSILGIEQSHSKLTEKLTKSLEKLNQMLKKQTKQPQFSIIQSIQNQKYLYQIQMETDLELPCYRNRIFSINLRLVRNNKIIQNSNNILVELQIWTCDKFPKKLTHNNHNQSIYKGCQQAQIKKGRGCLGRIQVREVSSHFPKGVFMLIIVPVEDGGVSGAEGNEIRKEWIKPLIIQEVAIKAKKFSDRHIPYFVKSDGTIDLQA